MIVSRDTFSGSKVGYLDTCFYKIVLSSSDAINDPALPDVFLWGINNVGRVEVDCGDYSKQVMRAVHWFDEIFKEEQEKNTLLSDMQSFGPLMTLKKWWNPFSGRLVKIIFDELKFDEYNEAFFDVSKNEAKVMIFDDSVIKNEKFTSKLAGLIATLGKVDIDFAMVGYAAEKIARELVSISYVKKLSAYDANKLSTILANNEGEFHVSIMKQSFFNSQNNNIPSVNDGGLDLEALDMSYINSSGFILEESVTVQDAKEIYASLLNGLYVDILIKDESGVPRSSGIRFERTSNGEINILSTGISPYFSEEDISKNVIKPFMYLSLINGVNNIGLGVKDLITNSTVIEVEVIKSRVVQNRVDFHFGEGLLAFREGVFSFALSELFSELINDFNSIGFHVYDPLKANYYDLESEISERIHSVNKYRFQHVKDPFDKEYILIVT